MTVDHHAPGADRTPVTGIELSPMRRRHLRAVAAIAAHDVHQPWSIDVFRREIEQGHRRAYIVAHRGRRLVGFGGLLLTGTGGEAHITTVAVDPAERGQGIGTRIVLHLARVGIERGASDLTLEVRPSNEHALALYRRFGFAPAGVRKGYYADLGEDALILWAHDTAEPAYAQRLDAIAASLADPPAVAAVPDHDIDLDEDAAP